MAMAIEDINDFLTVREVADWLRVDPTTVRRWIGKGAIEAVRLPAGMNGRRHSFRIPREVFLKIIETGGADELER